MIPKLFIIDQKSIVGEGIRSLLNQTQEIEVPGTALRFSKDLQGFAECDVLLLEHAHDLPQALNLVEDIRQSFPSIKIILYSDQKESAVFMNKMLAAGVSGYVLKSAGAEELIYAIKKVVEEGIYICTGFILKVLEDLPVKDLPEKSATINLSLGEKEVLDLISVGLTNREIAHKLFISVRTVESRRKNLIEKTGTTNTATLIKASLQLGLIN